MWTHLKVKHHYGVRDVSFSSPLHPIAAWRKTITRLRRNFLAILRAVVRRFLRNDHIVGMALAQARACDTHEARLLLHVFDRRGTGVAHSLAQTADELEDQGTEQTLVSDACLDALGDQVRIVHVTLEVAVLAVATLLHRTDRAHATIVLEALAVRDKEFAGTLIN